MPTTASSLALFEDAADISLSVRDGDDLKRSRLWPVDNGVIWIARQRPKTKETRCKVRAGMASHGSLGNERASVINRLFYAVGGVFAIISDVRPDVENICYGEWGKNVRRSHLAFQKTRICGWLAGNAAESRQIQL